MKVCDLICSTLMRTSRARLPSHGCKSDHQCDQPVEPGGGHFAAQDEDDDHHEHDRRERVDGVDEIQDGGVEPSARIA